MNSIVRAPGDPKPARTARRKPERPDFDPGPSVERKVRGGTWRGHDDGNGAAFTPDSPASARPPATMSRKATGGKDNWCTPADVLDCLRVMGPIFLDPCTSADNPVGALQFFVGGKTNGLRESWAHRGMVYVNPPYSQIATWSKKIVAEAEAPEGPVIVSLVAARPDSRWFFRMVWDSAAAVCFWRGRLRFVGAPSSAPFPSAVVYHGPYPWSFEAAFHDSGKVVRLR